MALKNIPENQQLKSFGIHKYTIISWGSTKGPILDAIVYAGEDEGFDVGFVQIKLIHPFPS